MDLIIERLGAPSGIFELYNNIPSKLLDPRKVSNILIDNQDCYRVEVGITFSLLASILLVVGLKKSVCMKKVFNVIPESGCLVITGILISFITVTWDGVKLLAPDVVIMICPIILHASYSLFHPHFFGQLGTILIFAFIGTMLNVIGITVIIYYSYRAINEDFNIFHSLVFGSVISAVDPVAVLAVFQEVKADKRLHYLIFGESLLNDGVTYVLFEGFRSLADPSVIPSEVPVSTYIFIGTSFITAPIGGILLGFLLGVFSVCHYKYTGKHHTAMMIYAFLAFLLADIVGFSGIISLITYGLTQERYAFGNMKVKDQVNTNSIVHGFSILFESVLFLVLGFEVINRSDHFITFYAFCLISLSATIVVRFLVTYTLVYFLNFYRAEPIDLRWQLIIILGGLRGAVAYAMVIDYNEDAPFRDMFIAATIFNIAITNLLNGILTKPLVLFFNLRQGDLTDYAEYYKDKKKNWIFKVFHWFEKECILPLVPGIARNPETIEEELKTMEEAMDKI